MSAWPGKIQILCSLVIVRIHPLDSCVWHACSHRLMRSLYRPHGPYLDCSIALYACMHRAYSKYALILGGVYIYIYMRMYSRFILACMSIYIYIYTPNSDVPYNDRSIEGLEWSVLRSMSA